MKFRNINYLKHFMINDQYKLDIVDGLVNCKTIKCNYVHYFMIISNYLFFDLTTSWILWLLSTHEMASYELFLSKLTTSWCKLFLLFEKILKQTTSENFFYICRHAFIKDLQMNCNHSKKKLFVMSFPCVSCSQPVRPRQHALEWVLLPLAASSL